MLTHPFNTDNAKLRLLEDYKKHGTLVVGVDFDNTIFDTHKTGGDFTEVISLVKEAQKLGFTLCLFTAESNINQLIWKFNYARTELGIKFDYINHSPLMEGTAKPFFNILLDDRAGLESAYETLKYVVDYANNRFKERQ